MKIKTIIRIQTQFIKSDLRSLEVNRQKELGKNIEEVVIHAEHYYVGDMLNG